MHHVQCLTEGVLGTSQLSCNKPELSGIWPWLHWLERNGSSCCENLQSRRPREICEQRNQEAQPSWLVWCCEWNTHLLEGRLLLIEHMLSSIVCLMTCIFILSLNSIFSQFIKESLIQHVSKLWCSLYFNTSHWKWISDSELRWWLSPLIQWCVLYIHCILYDLCRRFGPLSTRIKGAISPTVLT